LWLKGPENGCFSLVFAAVRKLYDQAKAPPEGGAFTGNTQNEVGL
jgi:hypothetical protein